MARIHRIAQKLDNPAKQGGHLRHVKLYRRSAIKQRSEKQGREAGPISRGRDIWRVPASGQAWVQDDTITIGVPYARLSLALKAMLGAFSSKIQAPFLWDEILLFNYTWVRAEDLV